MTCSTSSRPSCLVTTDICLRERSSRTTSLNLSGTIGRSGIRQVLNFGSYSSGSASCTRWPTAHVTTWSGPSRKPSCFLNGPFRTRAKSPPTEGFSAITRVFDMAPSVAAGDFAGARGLRRGSRRTAAGGAPEGTSGSPVVSHGRATSPFTLRLGRGGWRPRTPATPASRSSSRPRGSSTIDFAVAVPTPTGPPLAL